MKRVMFDTSVYGYLEFEPEILALVHQKYKKEFIIYGCSTIRKELRETPKHIVHKDRKVQIILLQIYDSFVVKEKHNLEYNKLVETLSEDYFTQYRKQGGSLSNQAMKNDLIIIATATIYQLDIIVSTDKKSMLSNAAIKAYLIVNKKYGVANPSFITYEEFKRQLQ